MKKTLWIAPLCLLLCGLVTLIWLMRPREFGVNHVIAQIRVGATHCVLTQNYQGLGEGNEIQFFVEETPGNWSSYYIEHEDTYWRSAELASIHEGIEIRRGKNAVAFYDLVTKRYYLTGRGVWAAGEASTKELALLESL